MLAAISLTAALLYLVGVAIFAISARKASNGYEDASGFHFGDPPRIGENRPLVKAAHASRSRSGFSFSNRREREHA